MIGSADGGYFLVTDSTAPGVVAEAEELLDETLLALSGWTAARGCGMNWTGPWHQAPERPWPTPPPDTS